ncbi:MAG: hypothetical protein JRI23_25165 [Deltaproteobacteria bacterium]|jgi:diacylglycerol kinase family enzyme|nr:hypothetical protein [Deltaproteobacteria bacterium]MBW2535307.1 hypothetical protein [Deltaproteobacteria bacterium]
MPFDLVINLRARQYLRDPKLLGRMRCAADGRCRVQVTRDLDELDRVVAELSRRGTDRVLLSGGDGTLMAGVTALWRHFGADRMPPVAPIPGGTVGTVARNWGVSGEPARCLRRSLAPGLAAVERPTLRIASVGEDGTRVERIGFIFGTGLVAQFFELYYERGAPGYSGSARIVARVFVESFVGGAFSRRVLDPLPCSLTVDGRLEEPQAWSLVCAAVVPNLGIHMLVNYRAAEDPTRPHLVASPLPAGQLGPRAPYVLAGRTIGGPGHVDQLAERFAIDFPTVGPYVLDGELLQARRVEVSAGPRIRVISPEC